MWIAIQNAVGARQGVGGGPAPPPYTPPLDAFTGAVAAYSIRLLRTAYTGPIMRVLRTSDNVEADVGFDSNNEFGLTSPISNTSDAQSYTDFADFVDHTGTPTIAYVRYWYDQTGNGNHGDQPNSALQCNVYIAGAITILNGKPVLNPTFGSSQMPTGLAADTAYKVFSVSSVYQTSIHVFLGTNNIADYFLVMESGSTNTGIFSNSGASVRRNGATYSLTGKTRGDLFTDFTGQHLLYSDHDVTTTAGRTLQLGYTSGFRMLQSQEVIIYPSTSTHTVSDIETNLNNFYQIGNFPDYTSGFLADYSGAAAAYSVRKLSNTAIKALRVRRTVPPFDELDIGFTPAGDLDEQAIVDFGGSNVLVVSRWYDQSGFSRNAAQVSPGAQPTIYNGTAVITENGKPTLEFKAPSGTLRALSLSLPTLTEGELFTTVRWLGDTGVRGGWKISTQAQDMHFPYYGGFVYDNFGSATRYSFSPSVTLNQLNIYNTVTTPTEWTARLNGSVERTSATNTVSFANGLLGGGIGMDHHFSEWILFDNAKSSGDRTAIETNINTYYNVYPTSGFLVDYPGSYRAYSLRKLQNLAQYAIRVQRHSGAFDEQDIGFTPSGDLDTQAIIDFAGTDVVGVKTWYNQAHGSSAQDLTQSNTAYQPLIFDGTSVYQSNGKPAIYYDAGNKQLADTLATGTGVNSDFFNVHQRNSGTGYFLHWFLANFQVARMTTQYVLGWAGGTTGPALDTDQHVFTGIATGTTGQIRLDGTASTPGTLDATRKFGGQFAIQGRPGFPGSNPGPGDIYHQEFIQYDFNNTGADVTAIENDIKAYYSIP